MQTFSIQFSLFKLKWDRPELKLRNRTDLRSSRYPPNLSPSVTPVLYLFCTQTSIAFRYG